MMTLTINEATPIGEGRWRVGHRTLDEVVATMRLVGAPMSDTILHLERLKWRDANPNPRHRRAKPSIQQTREDLKAGLDAGVISRDFSNKWWFDASKLGLSD